MIADNCAGIVNDIFSNYSDYNGSTLVLGAELFALQIYGDFSGYSDIPLGGSRGSVGNKIRNILILFIVSCFWHRANWTFIV